MERLSDSQFTIFVLSNTGLLCVFCGCVITMLRDVVRRIGVVEPKVDSLKESVSAIQATCKVQHAHD